MPRRWASGHGLTLQCHDSTLCPHLARLCQGHKLPDHRGHSSNLRRQLLESLTPSQCPDREKGLIEPRRGPVESQGRVGTKLP